MQEDLSSKKYHLEKDRQGGNDLTFDETVNFLQTYFDLKRIGESADKIGVNPATFFYWKREDSLEKLFYALNNSGLGLEFARYLRDTESTFNLKTTHATVAPDGTLLEHNPETLDDKKLQEYKTIQQVLNTYRNILQNLLISQLKLGYNELVELDKLLDYSLHYLSDTSTHTDLLQELNQTIEKYHLTCAEPYTREITSLILHQRKTLEEAKQIVDNQLKESVTQKRIEILKNTNTGVGG